MKRGDRLEQTFWEIKQAQEVTFYNYIKIQRSRAKHLLPRKSIHNLPVSSVT
jgi:hypothetical protein